MSENATHRRNAIITAVGVLVALEATGFLVGALLHLGVQIPLGFVVLAEPRIVPATIVEGLCGLFLAVSSYAVFTRRTWTWAALVAAHTFALAGVLLGMYALAAGFGPRTVTNDIYHRVMLVVLVVALALLAIPRSRVVLGSGSRVSQRG
jgi:hypothetical protein